MSTRRYLALALFSIAFGIEEAIVVLYLRLLPHTIHGQGPLSMQIVPHEAYALELARELCTLAVLAAAAWLAAASLHGRLRAFSFAFGAWDIVYYLALWKLSGSPSITSYDVLFLIPVPWIAPVWAAMAFAAVFVLIGIFGIARQRTLLLTTGFVLGWLSFVYIVAFKAEGYPVWLFLVAFAFVLLALPLEGIASVLLRGS
jgi:hypothetical protein